MSEEKDVSTTQVVAPTSRIVTTQQMEDAGIIMPLADPAVIRAANAERQRVLTSILDPDRDFLYSVKYVDRDGKQRQTMVSTRKEADDQAKHVGGVWSAHPKKSGVLKLAHALGIESKKVETTGLPKDPRATYSSCTYIATHKRTGRQEEGQGYCDKTEKAGMQNHAIISMADTRAYCHAVLRCAGYDNVGAESMVTDGIDDDFITIHNTIPVERARPALASMAAPRTINDELAATAPPAAEAVPAVATPAAATASTTASAPASQPASQPSSPASSPASTEGLITNAQAAELSQLLLAKLGSKDKARGWLMENANVERSLHVREDQIGKLKSMLNALEAP